MKEPAFTPGPLKIGSASDYYAVRDKWGNVTAFPNPGHFSPITQRANMMLYAAAPDLRDSLEDVSILLASIAKTLCNACGECDKMKKTEDGYLDCCGGDVDRVLARARNALDKSIGRRRKKKVSFLFNDKHETGIEESER